MKNHWNNPWNPEYREDKNFFLSLITVDVIVFALLSTVIVGLVLLTNHLLNQLILCTT